MSLREPRETVNLAELYEQELMPWSRAQEAVGSGPLGPDVAAFLGTVRPNGRPHSAGVGLAEHDGHIYFTSGPGARKARNLAENPACTLSLRLPGIDLILEGEAERILDPSTIEQVAAAYREGGWPAERDGDALTAPYSAQSAGPPPWQLYRLNVRTAFGVALSEPHGASRWSF